MQVGASSSAPDDAGDASQVGAGLDPREAGLEEQLAHRRRLAGADLQRQRRAPPPRQPGSRRGSRRVRPARRATPRAAPTWSPRAPGRPIRSRRRRAGWRRQDRMLPPRRPPTQPISLSGSIPSTNLTRSARPSRSALSRATSSAAGEVSVATTSHSGNSSAIASAIAPEPVPMSSTRRGCSSSANSTSSSVSGRGTSTRRIDRQLDMAKSFAPKDVRHRLAPQPPPHHLPKPPRGSRQYPYLRLRRQPRPLPPRRLDQQQLSIQARRINANCRECVDGSPQGRHERCR